MPEAHVGLSADEGGSLVRGVQAENDPHSGRFPRPVRADEPGDLAGVDGEGHPVQCQGGSEALAETVDFDSGVHGENVRDSRPPGRHACE